MVASVASIVEACSGRRAMLLVQSILQAQSTDPVADGSEAGLLLSQLFIFCRQPTFTCLRDEIGEDRHSVFDPVAAEAVDGPFCIVIE
jgi:hypothetical protein